MKKITSILLLFFLTVSLNSSAQCTFRNTAFKSGEYLSYNLYYSTCRKLSKYISFC